MVLFDVALAYVQVMLNVLTILAVVVAYLAWIGPFMALSVNLPDNPFEIERILFGVSWHCVFSPPFVCLSLISEGIPERAENTGVSEFLSFAVSLTRTCSYSSVCVLEP